MRLAVAIDGVITALTVVGDHRAGLFVILLEALVYDRFGVVGATDQLGAIGIA